MSSRNIINYAQKNDRIESKTEENINNNNSKSKNVVLPFPKLYLWHSNKLCIKDNLPEEKSKMDTIEEEEMPSALRLATNTSVSLCYRQVFNYFASIFFTEEKKKEREVIIVKNKRPCITKILFWKKRKYILQNELQKDVNFYIFISKIDLDIQDEKHYLILQNILYSLTQNEDINIDELYIKSFYQSLRNITKRNMTIFSLLFILRIIEKHPSYTKNWFSINKDKEQNNQIKNYIAFLDILAYIVINILREDVLNNILIKRKNVSQTIKEFFFGLIYTCDNEYKNDKLYINDSLNEKLFNKIMEICKTKPIVVISKYKMFNDKFPEIRSLSSSNFDY